MKFLEGWKINTKKLPTYKAFSGVFKEELDLQLLVMLSKRKEYSKETITTLNNHIIKKMFQDSTNTHTTQYKQSYKMGRFYGNTITNTQKKIKHTLFTYLGWTDLDMQKGHPTLILEWAKQNNEDFPTIREYVKNPQEQFTLMTEHYGDELEDHQKKWLFNMMIYGGSHKSWVEGITDPPPEDLQRGYVAKKLKTILPRPFETEFKKECNKLKNIIFQANPEMAKILKEDIPDKKKTELNEMGISFFDGDVEGDVEAETPETEGEMPLWKLKNRVVSYALQILENECLSHAYNYLVKKGVMMPKMCSLEKDGLCFKPISEFDADDLVDEINDITKAKTGFRIKWKFKPYEEVNVDEGLISIREDYDMGLTEDHSLDFKKEDEKYYAMKEDFEKNIFKVKGRDHFVRKNGKKYEFYDTTKLIKGWKHLSYGFQMRETEYGKIEDKSKPLTFIDRWVSDEQIKMYDEVGVYPPPMEVPEGHFNLWTPFTFEDCEDDYEKDEEGLKEILDFIKILCRNEDEPFTFFIKWLAHMVQFPAQKTGHFPIFVSDEGIGKGTFLKIVERLLGKDKFLETTSPEQSVWGKFNTLMSSAYFVYINEFGKKNQEEADGRIKGLLTDGNLIIEAKGKDAYPVISYHRFMGSTNNEDPTQVKKGNRRKWIVRCSDELKNNGKRFAELYKYIDSDNVMRTFYDYLMEVKCDDLLYTQPPKTEYQKIMENSNENIMESFLKWSVEDLIHNGNDMDTTASTPSTHTKNDVEYTSTELYEKFKRFKTRNHIHNYESSPSAIAKRVQMYAFNFNSVSNDGKLLIRQKKGRLRNYTIINWKDIMNFYGITEHECLISLQNTDDEYSDD